MQAFIDPTTNVEIVTGWLPPVPPFTKSTPIMTPITNSGRIVQVEPDNQVFPISEPYFWTACADNVTPETYYYDTVTKEILIIPTNNSVNNTTGTQTI